MVLGFSKMKDTKEQILQAAYNILLNGNYESLTFSSIGKATGLTKGAVYHHFSSKEELFKAVIDKYIMVHKHYDMDACDTLESYIQQSINIVKNEVCIKSNDGHFEKSLPLQYISINIEAFRHYPSYDKIGLSFYSNEVGKWKVVLEKAVKSGEIRDDLDTNAMAYTLMMFGTGVLMNLILFNTIEEVVDIYEKQISEFYKAIKR